MSSIEARTSPTLCDCQQERFDCVSRIRRWTTGDQLASSELIARFDPMVMNKARRGLRSDHHSEAEDCRQDVWKKVFGPKDHPRLHVWLARNDRGPFCRWLKVLASRIVIEWNRRRSRPAPLPDDIDHPDDSHISKVGSESLQRLRDVVQELSPQHRELYRLRFEMGLEWKEVARRLGISVETAYGWQREVIAFLKRRLRDEDK